jgi:ABC-2 type transport system permease protein
LLLLSGVTTAVTCLLHLRLRQQFRGENLSEVAARPAIPASSQAIALGWNLPGFSPSVSAVFEKEVRYLGRSGPMLLTLIMPIFMLLIFRLGPLNPMRQSGFFHHTSDMAFPSAAAYSLLVLTNLVYNSFGGEAGGMQFFYAAPVTFRQILLGKNLMHAAIVVANTALAWIAVATFYGAPSAAVTIATLTGILFAAPLNFTAGDLLSFYSPKKRDFSTFGRQNVSQLTVLVSLGVQIVIVGIGAGVFLISRLYGNLWIAAGVFTVLGVVSLAVYRYVLRLIDGIAIERREAMLGEVCRA